MKPGPKPIVLRCNPYRSRTLAKKLLPFIERYGAKNSAVLVPSIRTNKPLRGLTNRLAKQYRKQIAVSTDQEALLDERMIRGKMCVSTIHQFKGSERDLVVLLGIDALFFRYFGRHLPDDRCPNEVFVALTRAAKQLILIHDDNEALMPFVPVKALQETAEIVNLTNNQAGIASPGAPGRPPELAFILPASIPVRDMAQYMRDDILHNIVNRYLRIRRLPPLPEEEHINLPGVVRSDPPRSYYEAVSDLNGLVVSAAAEHALAGTLTALGHDENATNDKAPPADSQQYVPWLCRHAC